MIETEARHARAVVEHFRSLLSPDVAAGIGDEGFAELALLIESAVDTAVIAELQAVGRELESLAEQVRRRSVADRG